ncbi:hypothetical protein AVEN_87913-1 [Araneus ventricosus]|uniref:Uncharacterized protein n=1 Tax=Araneus ventricosus TaxID=182803 RepID=A0A4Y2BDZ5_ARAVE|nr:hypothetical protein AVEN_87913-1 [Araneus ventricosus]
MLATRSENPYLYGDLIYVLVGPPSLPWYPGQLKEWALQQLRSLRSEYPTTASSKEVRIVIGDRGEPLFIRRPHATYSGAAQSCPGIRSTEDRRCSSSDAEVGVLTAIASSRRRYIVISDSLTAQDQGENLAYYTDSRIRICACGAASPALVSGQLKNGLQQSDSLRFDILTATSWLRRRYGYCHRGDR